MEFSILFLISEIWIIEKEILYTVQNCNNPAFKMPYLLSKIAIEMGVGGKCKKVWRSNSRMAVRRQSWIGSQEPTVAIGEHTCIGTKRKKNG